MTPLTATPYTTAADLVRERVLVRGTSLCRARDRCWRAPELAALHTRVRAAAAAADGDVHLRWGRALDGAEDQLVRLAGEALAVHLLIADDIRGATKRALVVGTLARMSRPVALAPAVDAAFDHGRTPTGIAFKRRRLSQVAFLLTALAAWRREPGRIRAAALDDPDSFRDWLWTLPVDGGQAQREALLHLAHPDHFEPMVSRAAKERIVAAFADPDDPGDVDLALAAIRARLTPVHGPGFSFGDPPLAERWLQQR
jgi:hypothetical protein